MNRRVNSKRDISKKARIESVLANRSRTQGITTLPSLSPLLPSRKFHRVGCDQNQSALPSTRDMRWKNQPAFPHNSPHFLSLGIFFCVSDSLRDRLCARGKHTWSTSFLQNKTSCRWDGTGALTGRRMVKEDRWTHRTTS